MVTVTVFINANCARESRRVPVLIYTILAYIMEQSDALEVMMAEYGRMAGSHVSLVSSL